ncbi:alkaline-phosphatase-like protein [Vararia minispora EC-137]|uniref:Alkaline-phosphatase-like protein n=1 Tax=Vararia minispora EC-137 TaxID=1314806 RepID=A0ACB8QY48_9AGAM|nr:alkaline-phosphatase-like protein [Vararia minispora EC-137]
MYARSQALARAKALHFEGDELRSNGTHEYKRTVLLVSIDGLRADYLDRGLTPHLLDIAKKGLRAKYMKPVFPTLTFPNHWALMTGLYAESHGIVANNFWDAATKTEFHYNREAICWKPHWWLGEPMWETAGKAGRISANLMWPGPPVTTSGAKPTYFVPWRDHVPLQEKLDQLFSWIDLPLEKRPQLLLAYEPSLDQAGHATGPFSAHVNATLKQVDKFAKDLHTGLVDRNLTEIVDVVFVSDHGMTDTSHPELVYMDDILGADGMAEITHVDGWPSMGLHFKPTTNMTDYLNVLLKASAASSGEKFEVFTPDTMPERYHFAKNPRIAPIYIVPKMGYVLTTRKDGDVGLTKGNHGYDNIYPSMHAMFVAHGPFSAIAKAVQAQNTDRRSLWNANEGWHSTSDDTYVMNGFENVQIYGLVMKLLGLEEYAASTNGTAGFWDKYF